MSRLPNMDEGLPPSLFVAERSSSQERHNNETLQMNNHEGHRLHQLQHEQQTNEVAGVDTYTAITGSRTTLAFSAAYVLSIGMQPERHSCGGSMRYDG
jgi:hypothetical protein